MTSKGIQILNFIKTKFSSAKNLKLKIKRIKIEEYQ